MTRLQAPPLSSALRELQRTGVQCDVEVQFGAARAALHRCVLLARAAAAARVELNTLTKTVITLAPYEESMHDVARQNEVLENFIDFIYGLEVSLSDDELPLLKTFLESVGYVDCFGRGLTEHGGNLINYGEKVSKENEWQPLTTGVSNFNEFDRGKLGNDEVIRVREKGETVLPKEGRSKIANRLFNKSCENKALNSCNNKKRNLYTNKSFKSKKPLTTGTLSSIKSSPGHSRTTRSGNASRTRTCVEENKDVVMVTDVSELGKPTSSDENISLDNKTTFDYSKLPNLLSQLPHSLIRFDKSEYLDQNHIEVHCANYFADSKESNSFHAAFTPLSAAPKEEHRNATNFHDIPDFVVVNVDALKFSSLLNNNEFKNSIRSESPARSELSRTASYFEEFTKDIPPIAVLDIESGGEFSTLDNGISKALVAEFPAAPYSSDSQVDEENLSSSCAERFNHRSFVDTDAPKTQMLSFFSDARTPKNTLYITGNLPATFVAPNNIPTNEGKVLTSVDCDVDSDVPETYGGASSSAQGSLQCNECNVSFRKCLDLVKHVLTYNHFSVICPICLVKASDREDQRQHFVLHDSPLPFFCQSCDLRFRTRAHLAMHAPKHSNAKPFSCPECSRAFKWRHALQAHMLTHRAMGHLLCDVCGFSSNYITTFKAHLQQHSGEAFSCTQPGCSFKAFRKDNLKAHLATHSNVRPHQCEVCGTSFSLARNLRRHMRVHSSLRLQCSSCPFTTTRDDKLRCHVTTKHCSVNDASESRTKATLNFNLEPTLNSIQSDSFSALSQFQLPSNSIALKKRSLKARRKINAVLRSAPVKLSRTNQFLPSGKRKLRPIFPKPQTLSVDSMAIVTQNNDSLGTGNIVFVEKTVDLV